jgi:hypothetical protein
VYGRTRISRIFSAQSVSHQQGTIVRMRMTDCVGPQHAFMAAMSGGAKVETGERCPEYVLVGNRVVYVISGNTSDQIVPLAETTRFCLQKNEILIALKMLRRNRISASRQWCCGRMGSQPNA